MTPAPATLHDGVTAIPQPVHALPLPGASGAMPADGVLRIIRTDGAAQDWPIATLREIDRMPWEMRLARTDGPQRLVTGDPALMAALDAALAPSRRAARAARWKRAALTALAVPILGAALWFGWPPLADALARSTPASWEEGLGDTIAASLNEGMRRCTAPDGVAALDHLAAHLAATAGLPRPPAAQVLDSGVVNAFAAPGRQIIIHRGLIDAARSPEEVAGILAHEIGHLHHRHGIRNVARAIGVGAFVSILMGGSDFGAVAATLLVSISYTRGFEAEADAFAADVLSRNGIGTEGLAAFFERMAGPSRGRRFGQGYLDTHPDPVDRAAALREGAPAGARTPAMPPTDWLALRKICSQTTGP